MMLLRPDRRAALKRLFAGARRLTISTAGVLSDGTISVELPIAGDHEPAAVSISGAQTIRRVLSADLVTVTDVGVVLDDVTPIAGTSTAAPRPAPQVADQAIVAAAGSTLENTARARLLTHLASGPDSATITTRTDAIELRAAGSTHSTAITLAHHGDMAHPTSLRLSRPALLTELGRRNRWHLVITETGTIITYYPGLTMRAWTTAEPTDLPPEPGRPANSVRSRLAISPLTLLAGLKSLTQPRAGTEVTITASGEICTPGGTGTRLFVTAVHNTTHPAAITVRYGLLRHVCTSLLETGQRLIISWAEHDEPITISTSDNSLRHAISRSLPAPAEDTTWPTCRQLQQEATTHDR